MLYEAISSSILGEPFKDPPESSSAVSATEWPDRGKAQDFLDQIRPMGISHVGAIAARTFKLLATHGHELA